MKLKRKLRRTTKQYIVVSLICIIVIGGAAFFTSILFIGQIRAEYKQQLQKALSDMQANQRDVFIAITDISAGDYITEDKLEKMFVYSSQPKDLFITEDDIGKMAIIDIPSQTQVLITMLARENVSSELREVEYNVININSNIVENDTVDIRICYPNGENYVVLSKKIIKSYIAETASCHLWLNEEEQLRMSAAIVDAALYTGSYLYVTKYIEPNIQEASIVNYTPSLAILNLLETDPNILVKASQELNRTVRKQLENRLALSMDIDVSDIKWDVDYDELTGLKQLWDQLPVKKLKDESVIKEAADETEIVNVPGIDDSYFIEEVKAKESDIINGD